MRNIAGKDGMFRRPDASRGATEGGGVQGVRGTFDERTATLTRNEKRGGPRWVPPRLSRHAEIAQQSVVSGQQAVR